MNWGIHEAERDALLRRKEAMRRAAANQRGQLALLKTNDRAARPLLAGTRDRLGGMLIRLGHQLKTRPPVIVEPQKLRTDCP